MHHDKIRRDLEDEAAIIPWYGTKMEHEDTPYQGDAQQTYNLMTLPKGISKIYFIRMM